MSAPGTRYKRQRWSTKHICGCWMQPRLIGRTAHFFAIAARLMRQILVDFARERGYQKRGGGLQQVSLEQAMVVGSAIDEE
jgi:hypothetical protein